MKSKKSIKIFGIVIVSIGIIAGLLFLISKPANKMSDKEIIDTTVENFMLLTKVPRPSHHEEKISNYLVEWAKSKGLDSKQDSVYNVMIEVPATKGMEDKPLGILQGHMDMVVAVADGKTFDKLNDPITVIRNDKEGTLRADGTSLGGDDGIGVAIIMSVAEGKIEHGPLRMIITVDEEDGMTGALNISPSWFSGASYLINIDNEWSTQVLVSTAAGDSVAINKNITYKKANNSKALSIEISNLKGGHSGVEIDKGRLNGIISLANLLKQFDNYELAKFEGGTASNAIPTKASATIVVNDIDNIKEKVNNYCDEISKKYAGIEEDIKCTVTELNEIPDVVSSEERDNLIKYITLVVDGVYTMSKDMEKLVESSSNLCIVKLNKEGLSIAGLIRSSSPEKEVELVNKEIELAKTCNYDAVSKKSSDAWPYDPNSKLLQLAKKVYKEQNKEEIEVAAVHAGLECGTFKKMKPDLDMISIGPDLTDGHTIKETIYINSIPKVWHLLEGILKDY